MKSLLIKEALILGISEDDPLGFHGSACLPREL